MNHFLRFIFSLTLLLTVNFSYSQVTANQPPDLEVCEDVEFSFQSDGMEFFDLTIQDAIIIGSQTSISVTYHLSLIDAETAQSAIGNPANYLSGNTVIYVRAENTSTSEFDTTSFNLTVYIPPLFNASETEVCDDDTPDGIALFDVDPSYAYYRTLSDAENEVNQLSIPFTNINPYSDQVYRRINDNSTGCFFINDFYLNVQENPVLQDPSQLDICNTSGVAIFDLTIVEEEVIANSRFFDFEYYYNGGLIEDPENYQSVTDSQIIDINVIRGNSGCLSSTQLEINVNNNEGPQLMDVPIQYFCANEIGVYDLTAYESELVANSTNYNFEYYESIVDMLSQNNPIASPNSYDFTVDGGEIFIRIEDTNTGCYAYTNLEFDFLSNCQVPCDAPVNIVNCYDRGFITYTFRSESGQPLSIFFNAGSIHPQDDIYITDFDRTVLYDDSGSSTSDPNINDLSGLLINAIGGEIRMQIQSRNNSNNCQEATGYTPLDFDVFCSNSVGTIYLNAFVDDNANGVFDSNETNFNGGYFTYELNNSGIENTVLSSNSNYPIINFNDSNTYDIDFNLYDEYLTCYTVSTNALEDFTILNGESQTLDFAVVENQPCQDLSVSLINSSAPPRPGLSFINTLVINNLGSTIPSGTVEVILDEFITFESVSAGSGYSTTTTSNGFLLDFVDLQEYENLIVFISMSCPTSANIGDLVTNTATYITAENDIYEENNSFTLVQSVVNSYDPNDKYESHGFQINIDDFDENDYLYYTIRFQNLGNAEAINIRIEDNLEPQLDASTFQMLNSSHDYFLTKTNNNLEWEFRNINLPSLSMDEAKSQGYVMFKIKSFSNFIEVGNLIQNVADIYFDFNNAITTNVWFTQFIENLSVAEYNNSSIAIYPNPAQDFIALRFETSQIFPIDVFLFDIQGKAILNEIINDTESTYRLNVSNFSPGIYFIQLLDENNVMMKKIIIN